MLSPFSEIYLDKRYFVVFLFCLPVFRTHYISAQTHIGLGYYDFNSTSRNIILWADKTYQKKHVLGMGIKYHLDELIPQTQKFQKKASK